MEKKVPLKQARLDYFLISSDLLSSVNKITIQESYRSDHSIVTLEISFVHFKKGKGLWKHNNSLLHDSEYVKIMNDKITEIKKQYALPIYNIESINSIPNDQIQFIINDQLFLETLLMELRGKSISYACYKKKETEKTEKEIIKKIEALEASLTTTTTTNNNDENNFERRTFKLYNSEK